MTKTCISASLKYALISLNVGVNISEFPTPGNKCINIFIFYTEYRELYHRYLQEI